MPGDAQEVLIVDADDKVRRGLDSLLRGAGLLPTLVAHPERALELLREKMFAVALVDLDTPAPGEGLLLLGAIASASPITTLLTMSARRSFEVAVAAFRAGAADVIVKTPDQVPYLRDRVLAAAQGRRMKADSAHLVEEVLALHEELMRVLVETFRHAGELEEKLRGEEPTPDEVTHVLIVDQDGWLPSQLGAMLQLRPGYTLKAVPTGGEALDLIGRQRFQIALVSDALPDLTGSMVVRTLKSQAPETIGLLYRAPTDTRPGSINVYQDSGVIPFLPRFDDPGQILERLDELRDAGRATRRERRILGAFRQGHYELIKRYAELRQKMKNTVAEESGLMSLHGATPPPR